jgi:hypothetical protein
VAAGPIYGRAGPTGLLARPPHVTPAGLPITGVPGSSLNLAAANRGCIGNWGMRRLPVLGSFSTPAFNRGPLPRVVAPSAHFHFLAQLGNPTPNTPQGINSLFIPDHSAVSRILCSLRPLVRALSLSSASHPFTASSSCRCWTLNFSPCFSCANPSSCLAALC